VAHQVQLGIASISAVLKSHGHKVSLSHLTKPTSRKKILREIKQNSPDIVCFSSTTNQYPFVEKIAKWIKEEGLEVLTLVGGIHATLSPEEVIQNDSIDIVCVGEGEYPLLELAEKIEKGDCKGIEETQNLWFKRRKNPVRPLISNLDSLPFPDYDLFDMEKFLKESENSIPLISGRGCPFDCTYCANSPLRRIYKGKGVYVRRRSVDNMLKEISLLTEKYPISRLDFADDTFTLNHKWLKEFSEKYSEQFDLPFACNGRIETINSKLLGMLKKAGCEVINYGVESGNEWLRREVLKRGNATNQDITKVFEKTKEAAIKSFSYNIIGLPFETPEMIKETIALNKKINPDYVVVFIFNPYPGTELYNVCKRNGWLKEEYPTSYIEAKPMLNLPTLTGKEILHYYSEFNKLSMESWVKSDYPKIVPFFKALTFFLGGTKTKSLLTKLKYSHNLRTFFSWWKR